jgi:hypothetical protein
MSIETLSSSEPDVSVSCSPKPARIFPAPWRVEEFSEGYCVRDAQARVLAYVVVNEQIEGAASNLLSREDAGRIARFFASLPDLIRETPPAPNQRSWWKWHKSA